MSVSFPKHSRSYTWLCKTIPVHMSTARQNAESFNELAKDVEVFPRKVATALRVQAQNVTLSDFVWNTLRQYVSCHILSLILRGTHYSSFT